MRQGVSISIFLIYVNEPYLYLAEKFKKFKKLHEVTQLVNRGSQELKQVHLLRKHPAFRMAHLGAKDKSSGEAKLDSM